MRGGLSSDERNKIREALLDYCGQDTLAMVKTLDYLKVEVAGIRGRC